MFSFTVVHCEPSLSLHILYTQNLKLYHLSSPLLYPLRKRHLGVIKQWPTPLIISVIATIQTRTPPSDSWGGLKWGGPLARSEEEGQEDEGEGAVGGDGDGDAVAPGQPLDQGGGGCGGRLHVWVQLFFNKEVEKSVF